MSTDAVAIELQLRAAVAHYRTNEEIDLAVANAKLLSGIADRPLDRVLCLMRLIALHSHRKNIGPSVSVTHAQVTDPATTDPMPADTVRAGGPIS